MRWPVLFDSPFRESTTAVNPDVDLGVYHCAIAGRPYFLDLGAQAFRVFSPSATRDQQDAGSDAGGQTTLSSTDLWWRAQESWHHGCGQARADQAGQSDSLRFSTSRGVDVWTKYELSLLPDTALIDANGAALQSLCVIGTDLWHHAGTALRKSTNGTTWSALATLGSLPTTKLVTDGTLGWIGCTDSKIKSVNNAGTVTDVYTLGSAPSMLGFSKGRLWAGAGANLYQMTPGSPATPTAIAGINTWATGWTWTAVCDGSRATYVAGKAGDRSMVWRIGIDSAGALEAATVAATLPDGETVEALGSYLGYILLGTSKGVRFCVADSQGDLTLGSLIPTPAPVKCFEGQDRFVWYGLSDYDADGTGLGRMDLSVFVADLAPAYASDLLYAGQGTVNSVVTFGDRRFFTVNGVGAVRQADTCVAIGELESGDFTFGVTNDKVALSLDVRHESLVGTVGIYLNVDGSGFGLVATSDRQGSSQIDHTVRLVTATGVRFATKLVLTDIGGVSPVVKSLTYFATPDPIRSLVYELPVMITDVYDYDGSNVQGSALEDYLFLEKVMLAGKPVSLQLFGRTSVVKPVVHEFRPNAQANEDGWEGTCVIQLTEVIR